MRYWVLGSSAMTLAVALASPVAIAQYYPGVVYNRPSQYLRYNLDTVGGFYTRAAVTTGDALSRRPVAGLGGQSIGNVFAPGGRPGGFAAGLGPSVDLPQIGFARYNRGVDASLLDTGQVRQSELMLTSGAAAATGLTRPPMRRAFSVPRVPSLLHAEPDVEDEFNRFFGLMPVADEAAVAAATEVSIIAALESGADARLGELRQRGLRAFREERYELALTLLSSVRRTDPADHLAPLLAAHAALSKEHMAQAATNLFLAVERRPSMFVEAEDILTYFGDPEAYEDTMRRYSRLTDESQPKGLVIKSYCAWRLKDKVTARAAIAAAVAAGRETEDEHAILMFEAAIRPALD